MVITVSKKVSNKNKAVSRSEHYTNLLLITVVEAMVLLIGQLLIYNGFSSSSMTAAMWSWIIPTIFITSVVATVIFVILIYKKGNIKLWSALSFAVYLALLMAVIRYIPNQYSEVWGKYVVNSLRGQKIGIITSVIYVIAKLAFYAVSSNMAEKKAKKNK